MKNFNLIVSTGRDFEEQAENEIWFNLLANGDADPIIWQPGISGLVLVQTKVPARQIIEYLNNIITTKDPDYAQFLLKIYPIDVVVPSEIEQIKQATAELIKNTEICQNPDSKYRISIRKRQTPLKTNDIISSLANIVPNKVSLKEYDWIIEIEIVATLTGITILQDHEVFQPQSQKKEVAAKFKPEMID